MFSPFSINEPAVCKNVKFENLYQKSDPNIEKKTNFKKKSKEKKEKVYISIQWLLNIIITFCREGMPRYGHHAFRFKIGWVVVKSSNLGYRVSSSNTATLTFVDTLLASPVNSICFILGSNYINVIT